MDLLQHAPSTLALMAVVRGSLRSLRAAVADLLTSPAPDSIPRCAQEAETLSAALYRLDRVLGTNALVDVPGPVIADDPQLLSNAMTVLRVIQDGVCPNCGGIRSL